jgi:uncharacterized protein YprB with RNaseH-like and TPR domain
MVNNGSYNEAYLDIETTGLSPEYSEITVLGIYLCGDRENRLIQLVGDTITPESILESIKGVSHLYTYNGSRFDLPFIHSRKGINLCSYLQHHDLMFQCWENKLFGGLKKVENILGIDRRLKEVDGLEAIRLWWRYVNYYDQSALQKLLEYNKEDVINL